MSLATVQTTYQKPPGFNLDERKIQIFSECGNKRQNKREKSSYKVDCLIQFSSDDCEVKGGRCSPHPGYGQLLCVQVR